jgi:hypothetical protein
MRKILALLFTLTLFVTACGGDGGSSDTTTTTAPSDTTAATETTAAGTATTTAPETTAAPETTEATETTTAAPSGDAAALQAALAKSSQATSGRVEGSMTISGVPGASGDVTMAFSGEFDNAGNSSSTIDMSALADAAPTDQSIPPGMGDLFGEMEVRTIGDTSYMRFGLFSMMGVPTEWVSMPATEASSTVSGFGAGPTNPEDLMKAWGDASWSTVEKVGTETVRGVSTTHYRAVVDVAALMSAADAQAQSDLESLGTLPDTMPVEFWIGDDGNVYRMVMEFDGSVDASSGFQSMTMTWEMYDQGADITIEAPPADQVTDGSDLAGMFSG